MIINYESLVTIYADISAIILVVGLMVLSGRIHTKNFESKLFLTICILIVMDALGSAGSYAMHYQSPGWCASAEMFFKTFMEVSALLLVFVWMLYVDYKLYASKDHILRNFKIHGVITAFFEIMLIINPLTRIMFTLDGNNWFVPTPLYHLMEFVEIAYVALTFYQLHNYRKNNNKLHFFKISPMMIPIFIGLLVSEFTNFAAIPLGLSIGVISLYFSMMKTFRYEEMGTGFYNKAYLSELSTIAGTIGYDYLCAICININEEECFKKSLIKEIPKDREIIHLEKGKYLFFTDKGKMNLIKMLKVMLMDAAAEYEDNHKGVDVGLEVLSVNRKKNESADDFIKRFM